MSSLDLPNRLGIKSYSFRHLHDNADVAEAVLACGVRSVDLSACHVDYDDPDAQEVALECYRAAGVTISGIGVVGFRDDEAFNRRFFEFARRAGCSLVSCTFEPDRFEAVLDQAMRLSGEFGMRVAIHNHGGKHWLGNATILDHIFCHTDSTVGLCLDTAWCIQAGEDPVDWVERFRQRIHGVHLKDFVFSRNGKPEDVVVGSGALDLPGFLKAVRQVPALESIVVEFEGDDAVGQSARCVEAIRRAWSPA